MLESQESIMLNWIRSLGTRDASFMINKIFLAFLVIFIFGCKIVCAQDPNYFILGDAEFKNAEIYSVIQTKNKQLYVGTNEGLYYYKHGRMQEVSNALGQKGTSVFNLVENSKNEVFCSNLNGQVFKVENNLLKVYFEIPEEYLGPYVGIEFDDNDRLIVASKACMLVEDDNYEIVYFSKDKQGLRLSKLPNKAVITTISRSDTLVVFKNNEIKRELFEGDKQVSPYRIVQLDDKYYSSNDLTKSLSSNKFRDLNFTYHQFQDNRLWRRSKSQGIDMIDSESKFIKSYFTSNFISFIAEGEDGILFLGTFGQGLFVIPDLNTINYSNLITSKSLQSVVATKDGSIFLSDRNEGILHFKDSITNLEPQMSYIPNRLFALKKANAGILTRYPSLFFGRYGDYGAIKNIYEVDSSTFIMASSLGVSKRGKRDILDSSLWRAYRPSINKDVYALRNINQRTNDVCYDEKNRVLYVATISSFFKIDETGNKEELLFNDNPLIINDLHFFDGQVWCATQKNGILVYDGRLFENQISQNSGLGSNYVYKFMESGNRFFISHKEGFQIYNINSKELKSIGGVEGIEKGSIKDFSISSDKLWFLSNNQIISLPLNKIKKRDPIFDFEVSSVRVGDQALSLNENITLKYDQNDIRFITDFSGIQYESEAFYEYQLFGFDKEVRRAPVIQNSIDYNYLPAGEYTFNLKVNYRNYSSDNVTYEFRIKQAFWKTYWFYMLISFLSISGVIGYIYLRNIKIKQQNLQLLEKQTLKTELVESELKSLRSQINPHFIFNSLNSIQDLILEKQTKASYDYIVLFSDLVRNALNYSNSSFITIEKEIEFLKTYLKLEELRFVRDFNYQVNYSGHRKVMIPALLIQPFVENAIVHGLFHKEGIKKITINFTLVEDQLQCVIKDNGIGRKEAGRIKERQGSANDSYALEAIAKRLKILGNKYNVSSCFEIDDIVIDNRISGTKVIVLMPFLE